MRACMCPCARTCTCEKGATEWRRTEAATAWLRGGRAGQACDGLQGCEGGGGVGHVQHLALQPCVALGGGWSPAPFLTHVHCIGRRFPPVRRPLTVAGAPFADRRARGGRACGRRAVAHGQRLCRHCVKQWAGYPAAVAPAALAVVQGLAPFQPGEGRQEGNGGLGTAAST